MLSERQVELLNAIINEYISSTTPVGSEVIVKKYKIKCSAATVRNEMARLIEDGFLEMVHTSSGRIPTSQAYRLYISDMMQEEELPVLQEVAMKQRLWSTRFEFEKLLRNSALALSDVTKELAVIVSNDGYLTHAGAVNILDNREFWDIDAAKAALYVVDRYELLDQIFQKAPYGGDVRYIFGNEMGYDNMKNTSMVFAAFNAGSKNGYVAVLGPARMRYQNVVPAVKYTKKLIEELGESW